MTKNDSSAAPELPEAAIERAPIMWKVKADALREAASVLASDTTTVDRQWLRARADRIERGGDA